MACHSLELDLPSTVFQQDHNGYTHQDPGILTHLAENSEYIQDTCLQINSLLAVMDKAFKAEDRLTWLLLQNTHVRNSTQLKKQKNWYVRSYKVIDWASACPNNEEPDVAAAAKQLCCE